MLMDCRRLPAIHKKSLCALWATVVVTKKNAAVLMKAETQSPRIMVSSILNCRTA
jgi:hypothetical protein